MSDTIKSWRHIQQRYNLIGSKCTTCGDVFFPSRVICPNCRRKGNIEPFQFSGKGKIHSFSVIRSPSDDFKKVAPYAVAIIELEEGAKLTSQLVDCDVDDLEETGNEVTLMTLHSAKGLEFPVVFLVGMEEGIFPSYRSIGEPKELEEERRLCYVGVTRAKQNLYLTAAKQRTVFGSTTCNSLSRFLGEIPENLVEGIEKEETNNNKGFEYNFEHLLLSLYYNEFHFPLSIF